LLHLRTAEWARTLKNLEKAQSNLVFDTQSSISGHFGRPVAAQSLWYQTSTLTPPTHHRHVTDPSPLSFCVSVLCQPSPGGRRDLLRSANFSN